MEIHDDVQKKRAILEDEIIDFILKNYSAFVMHGGTAVWRCYGGNRFSRDVDFYTNINKSEESATQKQIHKLLLDAAYQIREEKYNNKTNTLHIIIKGNYTTCKLDLTFAKINGIATEYQRVDDSKRIVYALAPIDILNEKLNVYLDKFKNGAHQIQDLYDIMILKNRVDGIPEEMYKKVVALLSTKDIPPKDSKLLKQLILNGVTPTFEEIISILEGWLSEISRGNNKVV